MYDSQAPPNLQPGGLRLDRRAMLFGALGLLLGACSSPTTAADQVDLLTETLETRITAAARDDAEAEHLLGLVNSIREDAQEFLKGHSTFSEQMISEARDRDADPAELTRLVMTSSANRREVRRKMLDHQESLRVALGEERWSRLVDELNDAEAMNRIVGRRA